MLGPGMELEQIRRALAEARRARDAVASGGSPDPHAIPVLLKSLSQLIETTECLLAERTQMESRLHRTPFSPNPEALQPATPRPDPS